MSGQVSGGLLVVITGQIFSFSHAIRSRSDTFCVHIHILRELEYMWCLACAFSSYGDETRRLRVAPLRTIFLYRCVLCNAKSMLLVHISTHANDRRRLFRCHLRYFRHACATRSHAFQYHRSDEMRFAASDEFESAGAPTGYF